jgi:DNA-binding response OmpR family regulator
MSFLHYAVQPNRILRVGGLALDLEKCQAALDDKPLDLYPLEFRVLVYLTQHAGRVITSAELWNNVWQQHGPLTPTGEPVRSCLKRLKRKLRVASPTVDYVITKRGIGTRMILEAEWHAQ